MTQEERKLDNQRVKEAERTSSTSTTTTVVHGTGRFDLGIVQAYEQNVGRWDLKAQQILSRAYASGMEEAVLLAAIEATGWAPRPSKQYLAAILRRYMAAGIKTYEDVLRDEDEFEQFKQSDLRRRQAKWYDDNSVLTDFDLWRDMP